jgi:hypothetical protein
MEPLLDNSGDGIPTEMLAQVRADLATYDEYHLVYALLLGTMHAPSMFIRLLPRFLGSNHESVVCTILNILQKLDDQYVTEELVDAIGSFALSNRVPEWALPTLTRFVKNHARPREST